MRRPRVREWTFNFGDPESNAAPARRWSSYDWPRVRRIGTIACALLAIGCSSPGSDANPAPATAPAPASLPSSSGGGAILTGSVRVHGSPLQATVRVYLVTPDLCAQLVAGSSTGNVPPSAANAAVVPPTSTYRLELRPNTYIAVVSPRFTLLQGDWFYSGGGTPVRASGQAVCDAAERIDLHGTVTADFDFP